MCCFCLESGNYYNFLKFCAVCSFDYPPRRKLLSYFSHPLNSAPLLLEKLGEFLLHAINNTVTTGTAERKW